MNQPPAFQFYASDYLSSSKVQRMTLEAEGAYVRLLAYNWQDGSIPSDFRQLSRLCKTTPRKMEILWNEFLHECFTGEGQPEGRLVNLRLERVRSEQVEYRNKKASAGQKGAEARWKDKQTDGTAIVLPLANCMANDGSSSPSPSSSPSSIKKQGKTVEVRADARRLPFKDFMFAELRRVGVEPVPDAADWQQYESFLRKTEGKDVFAIEKLKLYFQRFVNSSEQFHCRQGHPIRYFCANVSGFMREAAARQSEVHVPLSQRFTPEVLAEEERKLREGRAS